MVVVGFKSATYHWLDLLSVVPNSSLLCFVNSSLTGLLLAGVPVKFDCFFHIIVVGCLWSSLIALSL